MNAVHKRLDYFEKTIDELQEQVQKHTTELANHNIKITALEKRLDSLEELVRSMIQPAPEEQEPLPRLIPRIRHVPTILDPRGPIHINEGDK